MKKNKPKPEPELYVYLKTLNPGQYAELRKAVFSIFAKANPTPHRFREQPHLKIVKGERR